MNAFPASFRAATLAGLRSAKGDAAAIISADLQDPPELLGEMVPVRVQHGPKSIAVFPPPAHGGAVSVLRRSVMLES